MDGLNFDSLMLAALPVAFCKYGHAWTPENTTFNERGYRQCRQCKRLAVKRYRHRLKLRGPARKLVRRSEIAPAEARAIPLVRNLYCLIEDQHRSLRSVSRKTGYSKRAVELWRRGDVMPSVAAVVDLYNSLGYDLVPVKRGKQ